MADQVIALIPMGVVNCRQECCCRLNLAARPYALVRQISPFCLRYLPRPQNAGSSGCHHNPNPLTRHMAVIEEKPAVGNSSLQILLKQLRNIYDFNSTSLLRNLLSESLLDCGYRPWPLSPGCVPKH